jgi:hypothetical protein
MPDYDQGSGINESPGFGVFLARLSGHRGLGVRGLSKLAGIAEPQLQAVFDGAEPSTALLHRLAPVLSLHTADLFVIAEVPVPEELAPLDSTAASLVPKVAGHSVLLPPQSREQVLAYAQSLPQHNRTRPVPAPKGFEQYPPGFGAVLMRMLANRNLNWWSSAEAFARLTGGRLYLSAATVGAVGRRGGNNVQPGLLAGFAVVLGIPVDDLAALGGIELPSGGAPVYPVPADIAVLIWEIRRLTVEQVRQVLEKADSMRLEDR